MGAGKTTIGHAMAKEMGLQFYDLDWYIEMRFHRTVAQIFEERGEEGFREIERNMLHEAERTDFQSRRIRRRKLRRLQRGALL